MSAENPNAGSAASFLRNVGIAVVVLGGIFAAYSSYVGNSKKIKAHSKKAVELLQKDNPAEYFEAAKELDGALSVRAQDPFAVAARAVTASILWGEYGIEGEKDKALGLVERAAEMQLNTKERFLAEGLSLVAAGKPEDAEKAMMLLTERGITPAEVIEPLGLARLRQGKFDMAKNDFKQAAEREWRTARYIALYGDVFFDAGDFINAASTYRKALDVNTKHVRSLIGKARADAARGENVDEAAKAIDDLLAGTGEAELPPTMKARALTAKAEILYAQDKVADAEQAAQAAVAAEVKSDPYAAYAHYLLGVAQARQKKGGLDEIRKAIDTYPVVPRFYFQGALALAGAGKAADGQSLFDLYGKAYKQNDVFHIARGDFLLATGAGDDAIKAYDAALAENNVSAEAHYKKGYALQQTGLEGKGKDKKKLYDQAREAYEKAVGIRERYPDVYRQMGMIYLDMNPKSSEATDSFGKALGYYKEQKASKAVFKAFIDEVEARYRKAGLKGNAEAWVKEAGAYAK
jgi:tetratricopeptide (TPR) repeat protein